MNSVFNSANIIESESFRWDELKAPLVDFISVNPKAQAPSKNYGHLSDLRTWQAHFRSQGVPFAVCRHKSNRWKLWKPLRVSYQAHDTSKNKEVRGKKIQATCPTCGNEHRILEDFTGRGEPKFFCPDCKANAGAWSAGLDSGYAFHQQSIRQGR